MPSQMNTTEKNVVRKDFGIGTILSQNSSTDTSTNKNFEDYGRTKLLTPEEIENRVGFHKATVEGANATLPRHAHLRRLFKQVMTELNEVLPQGRARSVALERLEDVSMWAHKAVSELAPLVPEGSQDTASLDQDVNTIMRIIDEAVDPAQGTFLPVSLANKIATQVVEALRKSVAETAPVVIEHMTETFAKQELAKIKHKGEELINMDTPVLEKSSAIEMRAWILNNLGHVRGLCNLPDNSELAFTRWLLENNHITESQFKCAYPGFEV